jgi:uncharacterized protein YeaO (DUF488 family)
MAFRTKRAYDDISRNDGYRVLVDGLWPRGIKKEDLKADEWKKTLAPSSQLRKWFKHDPDKWREFKKRYFSELDHHQDEVQDLLHKAKGHNVTLVYGAKNKQYNNAIALKEYLDKHTH